MEERDFGLPKIDAVLAAWEELKSTLPDIENLIREGTEILKEGKK